MLVLQRKRQQRIVVDDPITGEVLVEIVVIGCGSGSVKLGVDAPRSLRVDRAEVRERRRAEAAAAEGPA